MKTLRFALLWMASCLMDSTMAADLPKPLKALFIGGGCCHDYATQKDLIKQGLEARAHISVEIVYSPDRSTSARFDLYADADWAQGYDVIIHDECTSAVTDLEYVRRVLAPHKAGVPAVNLHCAMHSYRTGTDDWFEFAGIESSRHGPQRPIEISFLLTDHPITRGLTGWTTGNEELYNNLKVFETATPLARGKQDTGRGVDDYVVAWVNDYHGTRVFSTTLGHNNELVGDARYLDLVTRGLLWACGKLDAAHLKNAPRQTSALDEITDDQLPTPEQLARLPAVVPEKAAQLISDVKVPEGFDAAIFATPPAVNYPVFVAAAPDGTLYVSSDGNGSLDRGLHRGRVLRVRDLDGDGRADEVRALIPDVDSPRGLVWDHDRLYLLHPPHLSVFIPAPQEGRMEQRILVRNIAFTFKDRPADHSSNGLALGVDGWLYAAIGDFGFLEAEGTDGRKLQLRGGGVVRVRTDGTGLELFSRGTRNILEVALSPLLEGIARDNTNDGGGWDVRLHHFTGLEDHGYPRLYRNFADEIVAPLADYGGGSGCGAAWIDEPGIPAQWNNAPFTADWGTSWVYQHRLTPKGATFTAGQQPFVSVNRVTDLDADAFSRIYVASWKGGQFKWAGNEIGYLVRLAPKGYTPEPLPNFEKASDEDLIKLLEFPSHRRRLEAQRTLIRRHATAGQHTAQALPLRADAPNAAAASTAPAPPPSSARVEAAEGRKEIQRKNVAEKLRGLAADPSKGLASRVAALFALKQCLGEDAHSALAELTSDPAIAPWAIRALTDREDQLTHVPVAPLRAALKSSDARARLEAVAALARLGQAHHAPALVPLLMDPDAVVAHTTMQALRLLKASEPCFATLDQASTSAERQAALRVLFEIPEPTVVDGLIARLASEGDPARREGPLTALCRLYSVEGEWKGDSWGTRPDTRGPYYQPEGWSETPKIAAVLQNIVDSAEAREVAFLATQLARHRIGGVDALTRLLTLIESDASLMPVVVEMLAGIDSVPAKAIPMLAKAGTSRSIPESTRARAVLALTKTTQADAIPAALEILSAHHELSPDAGASEAAAHFFTSPLAARHYPALIEKAEALSGVTSIWADAALLKLSQMKGDRRQKGPAAAAAALEAGWENPARRTQILEAIALVRDGSRTEQVRKALADSDPRVALAAARAAQTLQIQIQNASDEASVPRVGEMDIALVLDAVLQAPGEPKQGEQIFLQTGCAGCHTVKADEPLKGPYLGNIASIYPRRELAEAILQPNKTLAQGFVSHRFQLKDGEALEGFVIQEAADTVTIRNVAAQELKLRTGDILRREKLDRSLMPEGLAAALTVAELASLLTYIERLNGSSQ